MRLSDHAKVRWQQRCPGLIVEDELVTLRPAGKALIRMLSWLWADMHESKDRPDPGRRFLISANGVVVVACGELVVTVMRARQIKTWYAERRRVRQWREATIDRRR